MGHEEVEHEVVLASQAANCSVIGPSKGKSGEARFRQCESMKGSIELLKLTEEFGKGKAVAIDDEPVELVNQGWVDSGVIGDTIAVGGGGIGR